MGNRAIITSAPFDANNVAIYVHWNGGLASVEGFCQAARAAEAVETADAA